LGLQLIDVFISLDRSLTIFFAVNKRRVVLLCFVFKIRKSASDMPVVQYILHPVGRHVVLQNVLVTLLGNCLGFAQVVGVRKVRQLVQKIGSVVRLVGDKVDAVNRWVWHPLGNDHFVHHDHCAR